MTSASALVQTHSHPTCWYKHIFLIDSWKVWFNVFHFPITFEEMLHELDTGGACWKETMFFRLCDLANKRANYSNVLAGDALLHIHPVFSNENTPFGDYSACTPDRSLKAIVSLVPSLCIASSKFSLKLNSGIYCSTRFLPIRQTSRKAV